MQLDYKYTYICSSLIQTMNNWDCIRTEKNILKDMTFIIFL